MREAKWRKNGKKKTARTKEKLFQIACSVSKLSTSKLQLHATENIALNLPAGYTPVLWALQYPKNNTFFDVKHRPCSDTGLYINL
jgi:hypothetical protein